MFISILLGLTIASASCRTDAEVLGPNASAVGGQASDLELTYVCGNTFSVRNASADTVVVTWDVPGRGETGQLSLPPKPGDAEYSETYFTIVERGPVRLFLGGQLVQTKANAGKPPCAVPGSEWPQVRGGLDIVGGLDTMLVVGQSGDESILDFRTVASLRFVPNLPDSAKSAFLTRHSLTALGVTPSGQFFVQFSDPGPNYETYIAVLDSLSAMPEVELVAGIGRTPLTPSIFARCAHNRSGSGRLDWANASAVGSAQASDLELTYVCGNTFSVRNASPDTVVVTWDVPGRRETGQLSLPPKPADGEYSETYFTIVNSGPVRLFLGGQLVQLRANDGKPPCAVPGSEWPQVRGGLDILGGLDTALVVGQTGAEHILMFRTMATIHFFSELSDSAKSSFLTRHSLTVLGVTPSGEFFVQFADPGRDYEAYRAIIDSLRATPEADIVATFLRTPLEPAIFARYPHDGSGFARLDWANASAVGSAQASDLELTYVCGNTFSVRNASTDTVVVTWDVPSRRETGQLSLPPKPGDSEYSETYFTIVNRGPVRLFLGGRLIQTKANTGKPPCVVPGSEWPEVRGGLEIHAALDQALVVGQTGAEHILMFRTVAILRFVPDLPDSAKSAFLTRHSLTVLGATPSGQFFVQFADPGRDYEAYRAIIDSLRATPEADNVATFLRTPLEPAIFARYPHDGSGSARLDWANASQETWASRAIRAPLASGCETGTYGGPLVGVGVIEYKHPAGHPEFAASAPRLWEPSNSLFMWSNDTSASAETVDVKLQHATQVTGVLTASGDDSAGIAGTIWRTRQHQYAIYSPDDRTLPFLTGFFHLAQAIARDDVRVLSISSDQAFPSGYDPIDQDKQVRELAGTIQSDLLTSSPNLLIVVGAGNERYRGTVADYVRAPRAAALRAALLLLREDPAFRDRIIVVTGTNEGNRFWDGVESGGSNFFTNATDIAAPAEDVGVLARWTGHTGPSIPVTTATGTSLSAPHVAGVAAQLLSMDPTLTPAQVKDYILRGAMEPRVDSTTGAVIDPVQRRLTGAPQPIYQLDAYGALTLLSRERPATPICGFDVSVAADNNSVLLHRDSALAPEAIPAPADRRIWDVSVAQGGRLLSVDVSGGIGLYEHSNGGWIAAPVRADYESRIFL